MISNNVFCKFHVCRLLLQKERQQREDAERQRVELERKVVQYEAEYEEAREGWYLFIFSYWLNEATDLKIYIEWNS